MATLQGDREVQVRVPAVERLLRCACDEEEFPWFVSDDATIYDVCTLSDDEILARIRSAYRVEINVKDLRLPIWKLVDKLAG